VRARNLVTKKKKGWGTAFSKEPPVLVCNFNTISLGFQRLKVSEEIAETTDVSST
jgi:hypothetical protein